MALSFIQRPEDIAEARKIVQGRAGIMAKIEKPQALQHLDEIMELSDAIMVARGDLGVEMPLEAVPGVQKQITRMARRARQAGRRRDADAGKHDLRAGADARRSVGRGDRRLRGRRRGDALGGIGGGRISGRGGRDDEPHRRGGGAGQALPHHHPGAAARAGIDRRRHDRLRRAADRRDARARRDRLLHLLGLDRHPRLARAAGGAGHRALAGPPHGAAALASSGACIAS